MRFRRRSFLMGVLGAPLLWAADYPVDTQHPRLLLPPRRLRLLRRESERDSVRWLQFRTLVAGGAEMPEPGFAYSLYYIVSGDQQPGRKAIDWALGPGDDLRQLAVVFDWCQQLLTADEASRLAEKIRRALEATPASLADRRSRLFGAVAIDGHIEGVASPIVEELVETWWEREIGPMLEAGDLVLPVGDHFPLYEMIHVLQDNFFLDLRTAAPDYFLTLPVYHLLAHYPAPYNAPENDYRLPLMDEQREPDLRGAALSRAAALSMVAYEGNSEEAGFLQGWLINDNYMMVSPFGIPYEFLWANPYQPGLSYHYLPGVFYDEPTGRLVLRSSWEDDAVWLFRSAGRLQTFEDGRVANLTEATLAEPFVVGDATVMAVREGTFSIRNDAPHVYYLLGMEPEATYELEIDDEQMREVVADRTGVIELSASENRSAAAILREAPARP